MRKPYKFNFFGGQFIVFSRVSFKLLPDLYLSWRFRRLRPEYVRFFLLEELFSHKLILTYFNSFWRVKKPIESGIAVPSQWSGQCD